MNWPDRTRVAPAPTVAYLNHPGKEMKYLVTLALLPLLAGCATVRDSSRPRIAPPDPEAGVVYLIHDMPAVGNGAVFANGSKLVVLGGRTYTWFYVIPGKYEYAVCPLDYDWRGQAAAVSILEIEKGKSYYISVAWYPKPPPSFVESITQPLLEPIVGRKPYKAPGLIMMSEVDAKEAMTRCRFVDPAEGKEPGQTSTDNLRGAAYVVSGP
jgi:hypothetical protein